VTLKKYKFERFNPVAGASLIAAPAPPSSQKKRKPLAPPEPGTLEANLVDLAMTGKLAKAGRRAVAAQKDRGLPVTFKRGQQVIKVYPDGRREVLATLERPSYTLPKGVRIIR
jgi:hypothetical protein